MAGISPGTRVGHYEILSQLGAGGMGEVYLAYDSTLDRKVALKILPGEVASRSDRMRRFVQEAKAAAALTHPNIAHVYEIGEHDGHHFIAMEFVDGTTLSSKIHQEQKSLPKLLKYLQCEAELVLDQGNAGTWGQWAMAGENIYFISTGPDGSPFLNVFNIASRITTQLMALSQHPEITSLGISRDQRSIIFTQQNPVSSDIMLVENFR